MGGRTEAVRWLRRTVGWDDVWIEWRVQIERVGCLGSLLEPAGRVGDQGSACVCHSPEDLIPVVIWTVGDRTAVIIRGWNQFRA
ncbi:hypothetical protein V6N11_052214 [Hibiscus sabdariffa]|uniref:Uncharacterized protein n=1 Tax=Hibiscus sabdariffa TaxID=183260 RepID=A0ABR2U9L4_9ROSI